MPTNNPPMTAAEALARQEAWQRFVRTSLLRQALDLMTAAQPEYVTDYHSRLRWKAKPC